MDTLKKTADLDPEHISAYSLIIEEGTPFFEAYGNGRGDGILPDEDAEREMYHRTREFLRTGAMNGTRSPIMPDLEWNAVTISDTGQGFPTLGWDWEPPLM